MFMQEISPSINSRQRRANRAGSKGQILVIVLLLMSALFAAGSIFIRFVISEGYMSSQFINKEKAFYLAEAGLEESKDVLSNNPNWFTDNPHNPEGDVDWLISIAEGSTKNFGDGKYKIVRESGKNIVYSVGYCFSGRSVVKMLFDPINSKFTGYQIL